MCDPVMLAKIDRFNNLMANISIRDEIIAFNDFYVHRSMGSTCKLEAFIFGPYLPKIITPLFPRDEMGPRTVGITVVNDLICIVVLTFKNQIISANNNQLYGEVEILSYIYNIHDDVPKVLSVSFNTSNKYLSLSHRPYICFIGTDRLAFTLVWLTETFQSEKMSYILDICSGRIVLCEGYIMYIDDPLLFECSIVANKIVISNTSKRLLYDIKTHNIIESQCPVIPKQIQHKISIMRINGIALIVVRDDNNGLYGSTIIGNISEELFNKINGILCNNEIGSCYRYSIHPKFIELIIFMGNYDSPSLTYHISMI